VKRKRVKIPFNRSNLSREVDICFLRHREVVKAPNVYALSEVMKEYGHEYSPYQWAGFCECGNRCLKRFRSFFVKWA
jgi:hypothetical protein